jgi:phage tail-like protein
MVEFAKQPGLHDPLKNFKFRMKFDSSTAYVAGVSKVSALVRTTEVIEHRAGGDPSSPYKSPGRSKFNAVTFERGVTYDTDFEVWATKVWNFAGAPGAESSLKDFRRNLIVDVFNFAGQKAKSYRLYRCWVSEYQALPDLDANANAVAIEHIKVECEGIDRDLSVQEPTPAQYNPPS